MNGWWQHLLSVLAGILVGYVLDLTKGWVTARRERRTIVWRLRAEQFLRLEADAGVLRELLLGHKPFVRIREQLADLIDALDRRVGEVGRYPQIKRHLRDLVHWAKIAFSTELRWELPEEHESWMAGLNAHYRALLASIQAELSQ